MTNVNGVAAERLKSFIERIERLHEERKQLSADVADIYKEATGEGFDKKAMAAVIKRRAMQGSELDEFDHLVALYERAVDGTDIANIGTRAPARAQAAE